MALIGLTEEQNKELRRLHVEAMDSVDRLKEIAEMGNPLAESLALIAFTQARTFWELGDFEQDPRLNKNKE